MFAVQDQENLVHGHQTAAAAKPLNQGTKGYGAKTPSIKAPRTPFKVPLNDENTTFQVGKSILKTNGKGVENVFTKGKKGAEVDKSAFITPAGSSTDSTRLVDAKTDRLVNRPSQSSSTGHEDNQCEDQSFSDPRASDYRQQHRENAAKESKSSTPPCQSENSPGRSHQRCI